MTMFSWLQRRDRGFCPKLGERDSLNKSLYMSIQPYSSSWNPIDECGATSEYGGVYNLEFSPDGSLMVAACEKRSIVLYDPISNRQTKAIKNAHQDCVNCVKFLDDRMFATCSDDSTVALWDTRNLRNKIRSLHGHLNWVKNIEYSRKDALLVTSGFDGSIFTWDINSYTEQGFVYQKVFHTPGLMRCRVSPDATKLVICTTGGYLIIIHNLDLATLANDLSGFRPNIYRLMQLGRQLIPYAAKFDHVFSNEMKKNRVELVSDFPIYNDAEVISSLQIHPEGWCALSRNISYDESSEWTCVHDIQEYKAIDEDEWSEENQRSKQKAKRPRTARYTRHTTAAATNNQNTTDNGSSTTSSGGNRSELRSSNASSTNNNTNDGGSANGHPIERPEVMITTHPDIWAAEVTVRDRMNSNRRRNSTGTFGNTTVYGISSGVLPHPTAVSSRISETSNNSQQQQPRSPVYSPIPVNLGYTPPIPLFLSQLGSSAGSGGGSGGGGGGSGVSSISGSASEKTINQNVRRMLYYIEEPNKGKGFIKELCFSSDGRIICSPFGFGFRLLAFSKSCSELPIAIHPNGEPQQLVELKYIKCHSDIVVSTKFSPRQPLLASGCLKGKVMWHQPEF